MAKLFQDYNNATKNNNPKNLWNIISNILTCIYLILGLNFLLPGNLIGSFASAMATFSPLLYSLLYVLLFVFIPIGNPLMAITLSLIPAKPSVQIRNSLIIFFAGGLIIENQYHFIFLLLAYFKFPYYNPFGYYHFYIFVSFLILLLPAVVGYIRIRKRIYNSKVNN